MSDILIDKQIAGMVAMLLLGQAANVKQGRPIGTDVGLANTFRDLWSNSQSASQLQQERDQYRIAAEAEAKRGDELAARNDRLAYIVSECHQQILDNEYIDDLAHEAAFGKPSASQLLHDADFACEIAAKWMGEAESVGAKSVYADELIDVARLLRKQASEQEMSNG